MSESNPLLELVKRNPADFAFGIIGVPMALAAGNIARPATTFAVEQVWESVSLLTTLSLAFAVATLLCVYIFNQIANISSLKLGILFLLIVFLSLLFIIASVIQPDQPGWFGIEIEFVKILLGLSLLDLVLLCLVFSSLLRHHMVILLVSLSVATTVLVTSLY